MVISDILVVVHPWDLAPLDKKWDLLGRGHSDYLYERHIRQVLRPYILFFKYTEGLVAYVIDKEFRIHSSIVGLQDFVIYDLNKDFKLIKKIGIKNVYLAGYAFDICVQSAAIAARNIGLKTYISEGHCLSTISKHPQKTIHWSDLQKTLE